MTRLENFMLGIAKTVAQLKGSELSYRINNHSINTSFVTPETTDTRVWEDFYDKGNIYIGEYANPVKISPSDINDENYDIITTEKYKTYMRQRAIQEAFNTEGTGLEMTDKLIIANILFTAILMIIVMGLLS